MGSSVFSKETLETERDNSEPDQRIHRSITSQVQKNSVRRTSGRAEKPQVAHKGFQGCSRVTSEYSLFIYGDGPLRTELVKQVDALGIAHAVFLPGVVPDVHEKIADAEMFVLHRITKAYQMHYWRQ